MFDSTGTGVPFVQMNDTKQALQPDVDKGVSPRFPVAKSSPKRADQTTGHAYCLWLFALMPFAAT